VSRRTHRSEKGSGKGRGRSGLSTGLSARIAFHERVSERISRRRRRRRRVQFWNAGSWEEAIERTRTMLRIVRRIVRISANSCSQKRSAGPSARFRCHFSSSCADARFREQIRRSVFAYASLGRLPLRNAESHSNCSCKIHNRDLCRLSGEHREIYDAVKFSTAFIPPLPSYNAGRSEGHPSNSPARTFLPPPMVPGCAGCNEHCPGVSSLFAASNYLTTARSQAMRHASLFSLSLSALPFLRISLLPSAR